MSVRTLAWLVAFGLEKVMVLAGYDDDDEEEEDDDDEEEEEEDDDDYDDK